MSDTIRCNVLLSPLFSWGNPTQRPNDADCRQRQRAFVVSAVVNRSSFRAHKERTDAAPRRIPWLCQRGHPELSRCREDNDFLSAPLTLARLRRSPWILKSFNQERKESEALSEI